jgi:hypothetical protein
MAASLGVSQLGYSPNSKDASAEADEPPLLEAVSRKQLVLSVKD